MKKEGHVPVSPVWHVGGGGDSLDARVSFFCKGSNLRVWFCSVGLVRNAARTLAAGVVRMAHGPPTSYP